MPFDLFEDHQAAMKRGSRGNSSRGWANGLVAAGSITESADSGRGVHYPPRCSRRRQQVNLHPFGLQDYTVTLLGNVLYTSALGFT